MQSGGFGLISTHSCPQFWRSKKNSNSTQFIELYSWVSEQLKPLQPVGQAAEFKFDSKLEPLPVIWQSTWLPKAIPEDSGNQRFWMQNEWPGSWCRTPAQLGRVGRASAWRTISRGTGRGTGVPCCWVISRGTGLGTGAPSRCGGGASPRVAHISGASAVCFWHFSALQLRV